MTLSTLTSRISYPGAGSTGPFAFPFRILQDADLLVTKRSASGVETILTLGPQYRISGTLAASGSITLVTALAVGESIFLRRSPVLSQTTSIRNQGTYFATTHEDTFDRLTMQLQSLQDQVDRCIKLKETINPPAAALVSLEPETGKAIVGTGVGWTMATLDSSAVALPGESRTVPTLSAYLQNNKVYNVLDYAPLGVVINTGVNDATSAAQAAVTAAPIGGRILMPAGTYKLTGDVTLSKVGQQLSMVGATLNSTAGRLIAAASQTLIDGNGTSTLNFLNGDPGQSLHQAVRATGTYNGSLLPITGTIAAGATSFVATNVADLAGAVAGDWLIVGEFSTDWQRLEWKQILSVVGTTVNVTEPFRRPLTVYTIGFYRVTPLEDVTVRGLYVKTSGVVNSNIGCYPQLCRNFTLDHCRFDMAKGFAFAAYMHDHPNITYNIVDRQSTQSSAISSCIDGDISHNRFKNKGGMPSGGAGVGVLTVETGTAWCTFESNELAGSGAAGVVAGQWIDYNKFVHNTIISDGASIGILITGGEGNITVENHLHNVFQGVTFSIETVPAPDRLSIGNSSIGDKVRNASIGWNNNGDRNSCLFLDTDSTVATPVQDTGTNSSIVYKDPATGKMNITLVALPQDVALTGSAVNVTQLKMGSSGLVGAVGTRWSGGDAFLAQNATHTLGSDLWHQSSAGSASKLLILRVNGDLEFYTAIAGTADATFATFWGTAQGAFTAAGKLKLVGTQILGARVTGYAAMTGTANKGTVYDTTTVTLPQLAGRVMQLQTDLTGHGVIGA